MKRMKKVFSCLTAAFTAAACAFFFSGCNVQENEEEITLTVQEDVITSPAEITFSLGDTDITGEITETEDVTVFQNDTSESDQITSVMTDISETEEAVTSAESEQQTEQETESEYTEYTFRNSSLLNNHYKKHGEEMGFASAAEYEKAASDVVNSPEALHKKEKEDNDDVYYIEETNEFVIVSSDGYLRTYFYPDAGKKYYDRQ